MTIYKPSYDTSISDLLKKRFSKEIEIIEQEGFHFFSLHREINWSFSVILFFPVYVLMANNEYVRVEAPLRITTYHLLFISEDGATFAYVYGLGCKFYTKFMDGTGWYPIQRKALLTGWWSFKNENRKASQQSRHGRNIK